MVKSVCRQRPVTIGCLPPISLLQPEDDTCLGEARHRRHRRGGRPVKGRAIRIRLAEAAWVSRAIIALASPVCSLTRSKTCARPQAWPIHPTPMIRIMAPKITRVLIISAQMNELNPCGLKKFRRRISAILPSCSAASMRWQRRKRFHDKTRKRTPKSSKKTRESAPGR